MRRVGVCLSIAVLMLFAAQVKTAYAVDMTIVIMQASAGEAKKYKPLIEYLATKDINIVFVTAPDYSSAADMFAKGSVDAMFSGSGVAGTMIIKGLADPVVRPVGIDGVSIYSAVVIAPIGSHKFTGKADYFDGKTVIFTSLASAGEFYFHSVGPSKAKEIKLAPSHGAALDALNTGQANLAVVKNHVWEKEKDKYPGLEKVGEDKGVNPDGTLIVSKKLSQANVGKISSALLGVADDISPKATAVKDSMKIKGFVKTTLFDFKGTLAMLKKAGVTKSFNFKF